MNELEREREREREGGRKTLNSDAKVETVSEWF